MNLILEALIAGKVGMAYITEKSGETGEKQGAVTL